MRENGLARQSSDCGGVVFIQMKSLSGQRIVLQDLKIRLSEYGCNEPLPNWSLHLQISK